jgi:hypothetical protein
MQVIAVKVVSHDPTGRFHLEQGIKQSIPPLKCRIIYHRQNAVQSKTAKSGVAEG